MKVFLTLVISLSFAISAIGQQGYPDSGFSNKAEAKNQTVNGLKEGKWIEYLDFKGMVTIDTNAPYYMLTLYKKGVETGLVRFYDKSGILYEKMYYTNGIIDSMNVFDSTGTKIK